MKKLLIPLTFLLLPILEIAGFIIVGRWIGVLPTLLLVVLTSVAGSMLLRIQGFSALRRVQQEPGNQPGLQLVNGVMIFLAGILLIIPGFLTDILGMLLFVPAVRRFIWTVFGRHLSVQTFTATGWRGPPQSHDAPGRATTIDLDEGEFNRTNRKDPNSELLTPLDK
ncbi:FxsA family protein [Pararhizobium sp.]|uniref:FxsA family protein n=1 Tax=Pararhizobium sp. TaxID=1977563 RepID=UPI002726DA15|nr:FxsA family protein [Pararhizobium sp.]MDO9416804.1 FxsA family protein [Pararhizobium sp.]